MSTQSRRPTAFALNDPKVVVTEADMKASAKAIRITPEPEVTTLPVPIVTASAQPRKRFRWATLFWSALGGLVALGLGLAATRLIEDLFARSQIVGWLGVSLAAIAALALLVVAIHELRSLLQLSAVEELRDRVAATIVSDRRADGIAINPARLRGCHERWRPWGRWYRDSRRAPAAHQQCPAPCPRPQDACEPYRRHHR